MRTAHWRAYPDFLGILLEGKQPEIEGSFGEPDERDGNHRQRSTREHESWV